MIVKPKEYAAARRLRKRGWSIPKIAIEVGAAKSTVSRWVRDLPQPKKYTKEFLATQKEARLAQIQAERLRRKKERQKDRYLSGDTGRWLIKKPEGYKGTTLIEGRYVYEHRYLIERKLGRLLRSGEVVHHKNGDKLDNRLSNLEVHQNSVHVREHNHARLVAFVQLRCPTCSVRFERERRQTHLGRFSKHALTFCSRPCSGRFDFGDKALLQVSQERNVLKEFRRRR